MHLGDRPPDSCPDEQTRPVAVSEHEIGISSGLELGVVAKFVPHGGSGTENIEIRQHDISPKGSDLGGLICAG
jgi:hypothetical protein